jgi:spore germination protein YaaH
MSIHVVQPGDTIESIANYYGISKTRLIMDNGLNQPNELVIGQCIVIAYPENTYMVKEGDTLLDIANSHNVPIIQLLMNNPFLSDREYIYPGETLVIKYNRKGKIITHGNTAPYISREVLEKTLPYLTYLSVLNYTATAEGDFITYYDDTEIIQLAKEYGTIPLMLVTTLTIQGEANIGITFDILLNKDFQNRLIENILNILETKGYSGVNISFQDISTSNLQLYEEYFNNVASRLAEEGYMVFSTIDPNLKSMNNQNLFEQIDYSTLQQLAYNIIFMNYEWAANINPPSPVSSIYVVDTFLGYITRFISPYNVIIGMTTIGFDWELPYSTGFTSVNSLTLDSAIDSARNVGATIQFDEVSQTPYFNYTFSGNGIEVLHVVWFIDARSINSLLDLVTKYQLNGTGIWNITVYNPQLWLLINSQYEIEKYIN